jgi:hypothetical protein
MEHKIKIRLPGGAEFEASGDQESVNAQYEAFLKLAGTMRPEPAAAERGSLKNGSGDGEAKHRSGEDLKVLCERAFRVEGDKVSLNRLPDTDDPEFDAIALLLYAYRHLKGQGTVIVGDLLGALRVSGASFKGQASKVVARQKTLVAQTGVKRASRYTLTNKGQSYAEEVLRRLDL